MAAMGGLHVVGVAAGLWHTLCVTDVGDVYAFGGNQFGQLGIGGSHAEVCLLPIELSDILKLCLLSISINLRPPYNTYWHELVFNSFGFPLFSVCSIDFQHVGNNSPCCLVLSLS